MMKAAMKKNKAIQGIWSTTVKRSHSGKKHDSEVLTEKVTCECGPESGREQVWRYLGMLHKGTANTKVLK